MRFSYGDVEIGETPRFRISKKTRVVFTLRNTL